MARRSSSKSSPAWIAVLAINALGLAVASAFSGAAIARPEAVKAGAVERPLPTVLATASAVRTWSIALPLLGALALGRRPAPGLLIAAGLVQLGDAGIGVWQRNRPMMIAPTVMGVLHLVTARLLPR